MPRDRGNRNIYMRPDFYLMNMDISWKMMNQYTEQSRKDFTDKLDRDRLICERKKKDDSTLWKIKH